MSVLPLPSHCIYLQASASPFCQRFGLRAYTLQDQRRYEGGADCAVSNLAFILPPALHREQNSALSEKPVRSAENDRVTLL
jgi:hypothetical protein